MITWSVDENPKRKKKDGEESDLFKTVKLTGLTLEGAVFNDKFQLEDSVETMVQSEGFLLKISFYSEKMATTEKVQTFPDSKNEAPPRKPSVVHFENTVESEKRILVPI